MSQTLKYSTEELAFISEIKRIVDIARLNTYRAINIMQVVSNWLVGQRIVQQEQKGKSRADYGKRIIALLSTELTEEYGSGYSETNLRNMRKFYQIFNTLQIQQALPADFSEAIGEDVGQMDMYLKMYDELRKQPNDNPTIGIILCADTDGDVVRYSSLSNNEQLYASKYKLYLPSEEELRREIERQKEIYQIQHQDN